MHDFQGASVAESVTYDVSSSHRTFYNLYFELIFASLTGSLSVTRTIVVAYSIGLADKVRVNVSAHSLSRRPNYSMNSCTTSVPAILLHSSPAFLPGVSVPALLPVPARFSMTPSSELAVERID